MPYLAQRDDLPDTHKMWADEGSQLEATLRALGYVEVPAPGQPDEPDAAPVDQPPAEPAPAAAARSKG
jgi:hypothetical protein